MAGKPKNKKYLIPIAAWDMAWRLVAIRRALQRKDYKWLAGLAVTSSGGIVPMYYLWRTRERAEAVSDDHVELAS